MGERWGLTKRRSPRRTWDRGGYAVHFPERIPRPLYFAAGQVHHHLNRVLRHPCQPGRQEAGADCGRAGRGGGGTDGGDDIVEGPLSVQNSSWLESRKLLLTREL
jgi:hypothetical protein